MFTFPIAHFGGALDYTIDQSIRFNDNDTAYLDNTSYSGSPTSGTDCTFSFWVKRCNLSTTQCLFFGGDPNGSTWEIIRFESDDQFRVGQASSAYDLTTSQVFRDVGAWSHFLVAFDTDNGTAADRIKIYHNGSRITDFSLETNPSSGYVTNFNTGGSGEFIRIGYQGGGSNPSDVYLAEINFVDGQALDPTSFGETNSDTGQWVPVKYAGSYGVNGYYLKGQDSSALGDDTSGNGNDFTSSGLAAADQVSDSPTDNFATFNPISGGVNQATLSDGNLTATRSSGTGIERSTITVPATGNWYAEFTIDSTGSGSLLWSVGVIKDDDPGLYQTSESRLGNEAEGYAYATNWSSTPVPHKSNNGTRVSYGTAGSNGDVIGVHLNNGSLTFYHNNTSQGEAYSGLSGNFLFGWSGQGSATVTANFGQSGFTYTPPTGAVALSTANLLDPTTADGSEYFHTQLYTGTGSSGLAITNDASAGDFKPDILWLSPRSNGDNKVFFDSVRGTTQRVKSNTSDAEDTDGTAQLTFETDGFDLDTTDVNFNGSGRTYVAWQWKTTGGTSSSNTDGDITSTVSANATSGVSVLTYTGNGSDNQEIGHGIGIAPKMIITKRRDSAGNWTTYHDAVGINKVFYLNSTSAASSNTEQYRAVPTSSVYTVGVGGDINSSGGTYVAYCFAEVDGFSKLGSYRGNGSSSDGPFVYTGFKPRWVMIKRYDATESWPILDTARGSGNFGSAAGTGGTNPTAGNDLNAVLVASTSAAEEDNPTGSRRASYLSNGFKVRTSNTAMNASGGDYLYMAFAECPFKYATGR